MQYKLKDTSTTQTQIVLFMGIHILKVLRSEMLKPTGLST